MEPLTVDMPAHSEMPEENKTAYLNQVNYELYHQLCYLAIVFLCHNPRLHAKLLLNRKIDKSFIQDSKNTHDPAAVASAARACLCARLSNSCEGQSVG